MSFPKEFVWGAATAAFQIEGTTPEVPRGDSVWDAFCQAPGKVWGGHDGRTACMHIERWREDVKLMSSLGLKAYRLSIAWPRVMPDGRGAVNEAGLAFYDQLIDDLLAASITPYLTLYHWDLPLGLHRSGGWLNPEIVQHFADYTRLIVDRYSDRVRHWITMNEPQCFIHLGYKSGKHAPGLTVSDAEELLAGHHALLAHGRAVQTIREHAKTPAQIGFAPVAAVSSPQTERLADIDAAREASFSADTETLFNTSWWCDPVFLGHYPEDGVNRHLGKMPKIGPDDMAVISEPVDFCAYNLYQTDHVRAGADGKPERMTFPEGYPLTAMDWPVTPRGLYWASRFLYERYNKPLLIAENGLSCRDWVATDGKVRDPNRIDYLERYLSFLKRACDEGVPVKGYFQWSLLDNFEWAEGYKDRFGMIYVDFSTGERIPKESYWWYHSVIADNGAMLPNWRHADFPCGESINAGLNKQTNSPTGTQADKPTAGHPEVPGPIVRIQPPTPRQDNKTS